MNISINKTINNKLSNDNIKINIETTEDNKEINNLINYISSYDRQKIIVNDNYKLVQIEAKDILYFYSDGNYNYCKTNNKEYRIKSKLYEVEKMNDDFLRISKGCVINIMQVKNFDIGENRNLIVNFNNGAKQFVARRKIKEVMNYLDERMV